MPYKIYDEPIYEVESINLLKNIANGKSIRDEMEETIKKCPVNAIRAQIEPLFEKAIALEAYVKEHMVLDDTSTFLLKKWESASSYAPIEVIYFYDLMTRAGIYNKAVPILFPFNDGLLEDSWSFKDIELNIPPPSISNSQFFRLVNNVKLTKDEKLDVLQLYHDFDLYRTHTHQLLKQTEALIKSKLHVYESDIYDSTKFVEEQLITQTALTYKNIIDISLNDNKLYHIYPSLYDINGFMLTDIFFVDPYIVIGVGALKLRNILDNVSVGEENATQFLKCLSEGSKQSILKYLKYEPLYGGQLAEKLGCSSANVSQHMSSLLQLGVVHMKKENNRVYFHLNKDIISQYFDTAKNLFI